MRYVFLILAACSILTAGMVQSDASAQSIGIAEDVAAINELRKQFQERVSNGEIASAMRLMTDDAIYMQPETEAIAGNSAIQEYWEGRIEFMVVTMDYRVTAIEVDQDMAFVIGDVSFRGTPRNGSDKISDEAGYVWILRREDSGWKIARYIRHRKT